MTSKVLTEVAPVSNRDCFYIAERHKTEFTYPIHQHQEYELNFLSNCRGCRRAVGDSLEIVGDYDLCLLGGGIAHEWQQYQCLSTDIHEITIQLSPDVLSGALLDKDHFASIKKLLKDSERGVAFDMDAILRTYERIQVMLTLKDGFYQLLKLLEILYELSRTNYRMLATSSFANVEIVAESRRVQKVMRYIAEHISEDIRLQTLADVVGMTPSAFSRFFRLRTHKSISDYVVEVRLGLAARKLADSTMSILEVCYSSGFNNVSYFNRIFKKKKGCTPTDFRNNYRQNTTAV